MTGKSLVQGVFDLVDQYMPIQHSANISVSTMDAAFAGLLGTLAVLISFYSFSTIDSLLYSNPQGYDVWFQADTPRVFDAMIDATSINHYRTTVHPIFSLLTLPIMKLLTSLGLPAFQAGEFMVGTCGFLSAAFLFLALRGIGLPRTIAAIFTCSFLSSAAYVHWFSVIETYAFASLSICFMLFVLVRVPRSKLWIWCLASALTLSVTVTNWTFALSSALFRLDRRRAVLSTLGALLIVFALSLVQKIIMPKAGLFFLPGSIAAEYEWTQVTQAARGVADWTPLTNIWSAVVTSAVAPVPILGQAFDSAGSRPIVSNQYIPFAFFATYSVIPILCWIFMLVAGLNGGHSNIERRAIFLSVSVFLAGQLLLHSIYGEITFLYSAHFFPAMITITAFSWFSRLRFLATAAAILFVALGGLSNFTQFEAASAMANSIVSLP